ncbi:site-2 protease family protein [Virgibacillus doumboii]|uniref:site-2 protease family protein n=1 Tax=Virgibacillus doumboii TaxID=2697503 RepID=UPI0013DF67B0|nr:site-2 protease family protein [Virgibacillus doumboii]
MTLHKFIPSIHIHPILLVFIIISFFTGTFTELMIIVSIVLFHELGHFMAAKLFNWRIKGIMLWVFGGVMDTDEHGTRPLHEEMIVTVAGPIQHIFIYVLILFFSLDSSAVPSSIIDSVLFYNTVILVFNLLPIWPLDGGKLLFQVLSAILPYRKAYNYVILFSICTIVILLVVQLFFIPFTLSAFVLFLFLFMENRGDWKRRYYVFIRFLLRRYQGETYVKGIRPIEVPHHIFLMDVFSHFHREKKHPIYIAFPGGVRRSIDEMDCLHSYFHEQNYMKSVGEIASQIP